MKDKKQSLVIPGTGLLQRAMRSLAKRKVDLSESLASASKKYTNSNLEYDPPPVKNTIKLKNLNPAQSAQAKAKVRASIQEKVDTAKALARERRNK